MYFNETAEERFWDKVNKNGPFHKELLSRCWEWKGAKVGGGYGGFWTGKKIQRTHRVSWILAGGEIERDNSTFGTLHICHKCDNPACVRPSHLFKGTHSENMRDMVNKGRQGEHIGSDLSFITLCEKCNCEFVGISYYVHIKTCNGHTKCKNCGDKKLYTRGQGLCNSCYKYRLVNGKTRPGKLKTCRTCLKTMSRFRSYTECQTCHIYRKTKGKQRPKHLIKYAEERINHRPMCKNCGIEPYKARGLCKRCYNYKRLLGVDRPEHLWGFAYGKDKTETGESNGL